MSDLSAIAARYGLPDDADHRATWERLHGLRRCWNGRVYTPACRMLVWDALDEGDREPEIRGGTRHPAQGTPPPPGHTRRAMSLPGGVSVGSVAVGSVGERCGG